MYDSKLYSECTDLHSGKRSIEEMIMLKSKFLLMRLVAVLGSTLIGLTFAISASAANPETVPVEVEFVGPIIITLNNPLQFGLVDENIPLNDLITIAPNSTVTDLGRS